MQIRLSMIVLSLLVMTGFTVTAYSETALSSTSEISAEANEIWSESMSGLIAHVQSLIAENEEIVAQNKDLTSQVTQLTEAIKEAREKLGLKDDLPPKSQPISSEMTTDEPSSDEQDGLLSEIDNLKVDIDSLKQELQAAKRSFKESETAVNELRAKKEELTLDLRLENPDQIKSTEQIKVELQDIKDQLYESEKKERSLKGEIARLSDDELSLKASLEKLRANNKDLQSKIDIINKDREGAQEASAARSQQENDKISLQLKVLRQEKENLLESNKELEDRLLRAQENYKDLVETPARNAVESEESLKAKRDKLERESFKLSQKLSETKSHYFDMKKELVIVESLLDAKVSAEDSNFRNEDGNAPSVIEAMAYAYAAQGMYSAAIEKYEEALKKGGTPKNIYFNLGSLYYQKGEIQEAMKAYKEVLRIDPRDKEAEANYEELKKIYAKQKSWQKK